MPDEADAVSFLTYEKKGAAAPPASWILRRLGCFALFYGFARALLLNIYYLDLNSQNRFSAQFAGTANKIHCYWPTAFALAVGLALVVTSVLSFRLWKRGVTSAKLLVALLVVLSLEIVNQSEEAAAAFAAHYFGVDFMFNQITEGGWPAIVTQNLSELCIAVILPATMLLGMRRRWAVSDGVHRLRNFVAAIVVIGGVCGIFQPFVFNFETLPTLWQPWAWEPTNTTTRIWQIVHLVHYLGLPLAGLVMAIGAALHLLHCPFAHRWIFIAGALASILIGLAYALWYQCLYVLSYVGIITTAVPADDFLKLLQWLTGTPGKLVADLAIPVVLLTVMARRATTSAGEANREGIAERPRIARVAQAG
jgi:hypothetical protein